MTTRASSGERTNSPRYRDRGRGYFGTIAVSSADTAHACAEALSQAAWVIGELLAIIERLVGTGPEAQ